MSDLLFEYKVRYRYKTGYKEFSFYATTDIEEFLNRNSIEYVRNATDTVENRLFKENNKLKELCDKYEEEHNTTFIEWQKDIKANKKAIEYINENWGHWCSNHCKYATETINILKGSDKE